jgi:endonuclease YncB( thermonuclease family)
MALSTFLAIKGKFTIDGKQPDGDSIRFVADDDNLFADLRNAHRIAPSNRDGTVQLRLEGIDAPELHYKGETNRQKMGDTSRDALLKIMGFSNVTFKPPNNVVVTGSQPSEIPGAILTKAADIHGRPISYLVTGETAAALPDGERLAVGAALLKHTANYEMVVEGEAYCFVYTSTPREHRDALRKAGIKAKKANLGIYAIDTSTHFFLQGHESVNDSADGQLILPKLFRRCNDYLNDRANGRDAGNTLPQWMKIKGEENDRVVLFDGSVSFRDQPEVEFADLIRQVNDEIFLQTDIFNLTFVEK